MVADGPIQCSVITPERQVLDAAATAVVFPAHDGLVGILRGRAPLVCQLGIGVLRVDTTESGTRQFFIDGGFAQVLHNRIAILTERAMAAEDIKRPEAEQALGEARQMRITDEASFHHRQDAIARAQTQLKLSSG
jgi:F-type H+-transporting ATPase subunit epsilon